MMRYLNGRLRELEERLKKSLLNKKERQLERLTKKIKKAAYQHGYYLKNRGQKASTIGALTQKVDQRIKTLDNAMQRVKWLARVNSRSSKSGQGFFVPRLSQNEHARLMAILGKNHMHCIRPPEGKKVAYLDENQARKLQRMLVAQ